jgi:hypothetical protein
MKTELSKRTSKRIIGRRWAATIAGATLALWMSPSAAPAGQGAAWTVIGGPSAVAIKNGPWTLEQSGAANGLKTAGYCTTAGTQIGNPGTERMSPYYFPFITGSGSNLQGYFDWRPKDTDEAVVAASSTDGGNTWIFQDKVLELSQAVGRPVCPSMANKEPDGEKDAICSGAACQNADNGDDDGEGHQFVMTVNGTTYLYTLNRAAGHIDNDQLVVHTLTPTPGHPLNGAPPADDVATDTTPAPSPAPAMTTGLLNPDGILGVVPASNPIEIIYEQKILMGDISGPTAFANPLAVCNNNPGWANYYATNPFGTVPNDDITYLRLATTTNGTTFVDQGALQGLNDTMTVSATGTRWLATAGTIIKFDGGLFGLLYSGGNCIDGDSDAFHYVGFAESTDLMHWTVINGINNPIASSFPVNMAFDANGIPNPAGTPTMIPSSEPVVGDTQGFFAGRIYAPSGAQLDNKDVTVMFAGYHTPRPKNGLGDYRTIGKFVLHSSKPISQIGANSVQGGDD